MAETKDMPTAGERWLVYGTVRGVFPNAVNPVQMEMDSGNWIYTRPKDLVRLSVDTGASISNMTAKPLPKTWVKGQPVCFPPDEGVVVDGPDSTGCYALRRVDGRLFVVHWSDITPVVIECWEPCDLTDYRWVTDHGLPVDIYAPDRGWRLERRVS